MTVKVCFVGDDVRPPWNHASSILTKRLIECLSPVADCSLATAFAGGSWNHEPVGLRQVVFAGKSKSQSVSAVRLSVAARGGGVDVLHLVGTNALLFSPASKLLGARGRIVRHIFTPYDAKDRTVGPFRRLINRFFIDSYAFTTPRIGRWNDELSPRTRRFLVRPPINCDFYRPQASFMIDPELADPNLRTVLYMGPLMPTRFPQEAVLRAVKRLVERGVKLRLVILTSASRTTTEACERVLQLSRDLSITKNFLLKRVDLTEQERIGWYNSSDVVLFPYVGPDPEKLADPPFGILEAMACGRVVLSSDVLSVSEVVAEGATGFLLQSTTVDEIERGILRSLETSEAGKIERNARQRIVERFGYPRVASDTLRAYNELLSIQG
jgi:glycosyltransferase involved in cell wall biosynthesis